MTAPLLMIPGPIEISDAVYQASCIRPLSHLDPSFMADFARALKALRLVWKAPADSQPFIVAGGGTLAMDAVAHNLLDPGERAVVVNSGYFGDRMAEMLRRRGAEVVEVGCAPGSTPSLDEVRAALQAAPTKALFATHVDTSTGVRVEPAPLARLARQLGVLSVFDGVCATAAETFEQADWEADVYLTASQKAIGLPAGLGLWVASSRAMAAREALKTPPPMSLDFLQWKPILQAYETGNKAYFSTPATTLIPPLAVGLAELLDEGMDAVFARHQRAADAMRAAWAAMGLSLLSTPEQAANTLSAIRYPEGADASALPHIKAHGAIVAGGLHKDLKTTYFRVGHMGEVTKRADDLRRTVAAVAHGLNDGGAHLDVEAGLAAFDAAMG